MSSTLTELEGLRATIDRVVHVPQLDAPPDRPHPFVYFITIRNDSTETVTIRGRKWVVTDAAGQRVVVEGDGVVGKFPRLEPGEQFSYNSYHTIGCDSVRGRRRVLRRDGKRRRGFHAHPALRDADTGQRVIKASRRCARWEGLFGR
jgi:ApaG protein